MENALSKEEILYEASLLLPPLPKAINLEISNTCNLKCIFCINHHPNFRKKGFMPQELLQKIIDELPENTAISICGIGEPTIHPNLEVFLNMLTKKFINVSIVTNGQNLSDEIVKVLINSGLTKITISLDYFNHDEYRKSKNGDLDQVLKGITALLESRNNNLNQKPIIQINMLAQKGLEQQIQDSLVYFTTKLGEKDCIYSRCIKDLAGQVKVEPMEGSDDWFLLENVKD